MKAVMQFGKKGKINPGLRCYTPSGWLDPNEGNKISMDNPMQTFRKKVKGNVFKNKQVLIENIHKTKAAKAREMTLSIQFSARKARNKARRETKFIRWDD